MSVAHLRIVIDEPVERGADVHGRTPAEVVAGMYERHKDFVFRVALRYGRGDRAWAEDVTHEVFLCIFDHLDDALVLENPRAWLYRVATNRCLTKLRAQTRRARLLKLFGVARPTERTPEERQIQHEGIGRALAFVDALDPDARTCFYMHFIDGLPQKEIAVVLGSSPSRVCRLLQRVERQLSAQRKEEGGDV